MYLGRTCAVLCVCCVLYLVHATMARTWTLSGLLYLATCPLTEPSAVTTPSDVPSLASSPLRSFPAWLTSPLSIAPAHCCRRRRCCSARDRGRTALHHGTGRKRPREEFSLQHRGASAGWQVPVSGERGWAGGGGDGDCSGSSSDGHMIRSGNGHLQTRPLLGVEGSWGSPALRCRAGGDSDRCGAWWGHGCLLCAACGVRSVCLIFLAAESAS